MTIGEGKKPTMERTESRASKSHRSPHSPRMGHREAEGFLYRPNSRPGDGDGNSIFRGNSINRNGRVFDSYTPGISSSRRETKPFESRRQLKKLYREHLYRNYMDMDQKISEENRGRSLNYDDVEHSQANSPLRHGSESTRPSPKKARATHEEMLSLRQEVEKSIKKNKSDERDEKDKKGISNESDGAHPALCESLAHDNPLPDPDQIPLMADPNDCAGTNDHHDGDDGGTYPYITLKVAMRPPERRSYKLRHPVPPECTHEAYMGNAVVRLTIRRADFHAKKPGMFEILPWSTRLIFYRAFDPCHNFLLNSLQNIFNASLLNVQTRWGIAMAPLHFAFVQAMTEVRDYERIFAARERYMLVWQGVWGDFLLLRPIERLRWAERLHGLVLRDDKLRTAIEQERNELIGYGLGNQWTSQEFETAMELILDVDIVTYVDFYL